MRAPLTVLCAVVAVLSIAEGARAAPADTASSASTPASDDRIGKRVTGFGTVALGMPGLAFMNELVGARLELEYTPRFALGFSLAYANLKGKDARVSNMLPEVSVAYRSPLGQSDFGVPTRFARGYLPKNGPTLRLTSGFDLAVNDSVSLELALLEPMMWVARDKPELSFNFGAAVRARF